MKNFIFLMTLFVAAPMPSWAQSDGYYEFIPYYDNDPFLFCTIGVPSDCWAPINPATGAFTVTNPYCYNAYSSAMYARVCPHAFTSGKMGAAAATPRSSVVRDSAAVP
ncbi:hypothetical protein [Xanthomonas sacchari]|uniref:hypothetical protein n=1 Tax=Xanthomonas sacchari TaxID=56458 RepID=UPI0022557669|nr:hypothetical protein [Xanthomonas sacchari]MCW0451194.1 hypothetical protein [Xanthomonas sacchari]